MNLKCITRNILIVLNFFFLILLFLYVFQLAEVVFMKRHAIGEKEGEKYLIVGFLTGCY